MEMEIYCIHDVVADVHFQPFTFASDNEAVRMFANCVNAPDHKFGQNPSDYSLCKVGSWDEKTGTIIPTVPPELVVVGHSLLQKEVSP